MREDDNFLASLTLLLARSSLGVYFAAAGLAKVQGGVAQFVNGAYQRSIPSWLPETFANAYGHALPFLELAAGAALTVGLVGRMAAGCCAAMLASFLIALGVAAEHGPYDKNVLALGLALVLTLTGPGRFSIDELLVRRRSGRGGKG